MKRIQEIVKAQPYSQRNIAKASPQQPSNKVLYC